MKKRLLLILSCSICFFSLMVLAAKQMKNVVDQEQDLVVEEVASEPSKIKDDGTIISNFDEKAFSEGRHASVEALVKKAVDYLTNNDDDIAFKEFSHSKEFLDKELYIFVYDVDGVCVAIGNHHNILWKNLYNSRDHYGNYFIRDIIEKAKNGGGWTVYEWQGTTKLSYILPVKKGNKTYVVGSGFYPHSKRDAVVTLVNGAVSYFNDIMSRGGTVGEVFGRFNYSLGNFALGDLYIFALRSDGVIMAQGDRPGLIGQNALEHKDANGKFINKEIFAKLKQADNGVWVEYISKRAPKSSYAKKVVDKNGQEYFIACGYYPTANRKQVEELVKSGNYYLEKHGKTEAVEAFMSKVDDTYRFGDLYLFVFDREGNVIANGNNADFLGQNQFNLTDDDGKFYVQEIIEKAKSGGGWLDFKINKASRFAYIENVEIGEINYAVGSSLYPISKPESMQLLVKGGVGLLNDVTREEAFGEIVKPDGDFIKGDLSLFAFDTKGICYAYGSEFDKIWRDMSEEKDDDGKPYIKNIIDMVKSGASTMEYKIDGAEKVVYFESVEKDGTSYVVGSGFYR